MLGGALLGCVLLALTMANAGGAWDNAKKYVEKGNLGGKGSDTHKATVVGDTVGDPFKDTSGPSMNILINVMAIVSLVIAPLLDLRAPVSAQRDRLSSASDRVRATGAPAARPPTPRRSKDRVPATPSVARRMRRPTAVLRQVPGVLPVRFLFMVHMLCVMCLTRALSMGTLGAFRSHETR
jgi:hypothetical protein